MTGTAKIFKIIFLKEKEKKVKKWERKTKTAKKVKIFTFSIFWAHVGNFRYPHIYLTDLSGHFWVIRVYIADKYGLFLTLIVSNSYLDSLLQGGGCLWQFKDWIWVVGGVGIGVTPQI